MTATKGRVVLPETICHRGTAADSAVRRLDCPECSHVEWVAIPIDYRTLPNMRERYLEPYLSALMHRLQEHCRKKHFPRRRKA